MNHLASQKSLYLQQHARNPLDWYPWGEQPLELARREQRLLLLSIGYSSCHWCHVMEHEVFEQPEVAEFMNGRYVCIKVDREERPDLDATYMEAAQLIAGRGGWPLNLWLTPELKPVYAATYLPKEAFLTVSGQLADIWDQTPDRLLEAGEQVAQAMREVQVRAQQGELQPGLPEAAARELAHGIDPHWGGMRSEVKFPTPVVWQFLLRYWQRHGGEQLRVGLTLTLDRMADGGLYDHVGGGFHRYSTDRYWLVPHFEKMLYDNAQLASLYLDAGRALREPRFSAVARDVMEFLLAEMSPPEGGFYASFDADSGEGEGAYYVWTPGELGEVAGADGSALAEVLGVEDEPNFHDHHGKVAGSIATRRIPDPRGLFERYRQAMRGYRSRREAPALDHKIVAAWNGMAISACAKGYLAFGAERYLNRAIATADYLRRVHWCPQDGLWRASHGGEPVVAPGVLDDYALLAQGLLDLFEASGDAAYLAWALELIAYAREHFGNPDGGYLMTEAAHDELPFPRRIELHDSVEPSGASALVRAMLKAAVLTGDEALRVEAIGQLEEFAGAMRRSPQGMSNWLTGALEALGPVQLVVLAGDHQTTETAAMLRTYCESAFLDAALCLVQAAGAGDAQLELQPVLAEKTAVNGRATAYVCERGVCRAPVQDAVELQEELRTETTG
jgi:uncharacterized protein YyaL (SSP411 family)